MVLKPDTFENVKLHGTSKNNFSPTKEVENINIKNPYNLSSEAQTNLYNKTTLKYYDEKAIDNNQKYLDMKIINNK